MSLFVIIDFFIFYDEIQYLKNWEVYLKSLVDSFRSVKFVASGSAAAALKMKSNESGAGRFTDFMLPPLTFYEFLNLQSLNNIIIEKSEVDMVWTDAATQKAFSLAEVKWTDRFYNNPTELKSLNKFLESNKDIRKIIVTTKSKTGAYDSTQGKILFIPAAIYAYWISAYLFNNKKTSLLTPNDVS